MQYSLLASLLLSFAPSLLITVLGCGGSWAEPTCRAEPMGAVTVFLDASNTSRSLHVSGTIEEFGPIDELGFRHYLIQDASGEKHRLTFGSPTGPPPFEVGRLYSVQVDYIPGMPSPNGIVVTDDQGLLFAAAGDYGPGNRVLVDGVPGFRLDLEPSDCPNRSRSRCYESVVNLRLRAEFAGQTVMLFQGQSARLGPYIVACLLAQDVVYSDECADAGLFRVAYTISRVSD